MKNDVKGMYRDNLGKTEIVGINTVFEEPESPDLILETDHMSIEETYQAVLDYIADKYGKVY